MKSADKEVLKAVNAALETAIIGSSLSASVEPIAGKDFPLIVTGQGTEIQTRPYKDADSAQVTRTIRSYSHEKLEAMNLAELVTETLTVASNLSISGFKIAQITQEMSEPLDTVDDTGREYSYAQRFRFELDPVSP